MTVDGTQTDPDDQKMKCGWKAFEDATGITVNYIGNKEFEARISIAVDAGQAPDIADFPQPGLLRRFVEAGKIVDVNTLHPGGLPDGDLQSELAGHGHDEGAERDRSRPVSGTARFVKSLVWYPKDDFDKAGYKVPQTWDEMLALSDQIVADGDTPWCIGIESQAATGWPATDWMEDVMLRTTTPGELRCVGGRHTAVLTRPR